MRKPECGGHGHALHTQALRRGTSEHTPRRAGGAWAASSSTHSLARRPNQPRKGAVALPHAHAQNAWHSILPLSVAIILGGQRDTHPTTLWDLCGIAHSQHSSVSAVIPQKPLSTTSLQDFTRSRSAAAMTSSPITLPTASATSSWTLASEASTQLGWAPKASTS